LENFGTWRDQEGRLIWGINDLDEAARMPYTLDLVRLVTSVIIAGRENKLKISPAQAASAVLDGYTESLQERGVPFVLEEQHPALREMALVSDREPREFWKKLQKSDGPKKAQKSKTDPLPENVQKLLERTLPTEADGVRIKHRAAGLGSLGRPRYVGIANYNGGLMAREAKAWLPSAWGWARGKPKEKIYALSLLKLSVRQPDPFYTIEDGWIVRRLGPHCGRIELNQFPRQRDERRILMAMGKEVANVHLATQEEQSRVRRDLKRRKSGWLVRAAQAMSEATEREWREYRSARQTDQWQT